MGVDDDIDVKTGKILYGFIEEFLKSSKENITDYFKKNKFGLLPQGQDYSDLQRSIKAKKQLIEQIVFLIGKPKTFQALVAGIHLNCLPSDQRKEKYPEFKETIYKKFGKDGIAVFNMGCTGFIVGYVKLLQDESREENLNQDERIENFNEIIGDWEERSFFVNSEKSKEIIIKTCRRRMEFGKTLFFVFAAGGEVIKTKKAINLLTKNEIHKDNGYEIRKYWLNSRRSECVWFFRKKTLLELR